MVKPTLRGAGVLLVLPDGQLVLQRRDEHAASNPNKLGLFGGLVHPGESPLQAITRELTEETSLEVRSLKLLHLFRLLVPGKNELPPMSIDVYKSDISNDGFEVYEGKGFEKYSLADLLLRNDVDYYVKAILDRLESESHGIK